MFHPVLRAGTCRHALSTHPAAVLFAAGLTAAALLGTAGPAAAEPGGDAWHRLRVCESGNNYRANTGNSFYGAYQFTLGTWHAYGGAGLPSSAAPAEQDYRAKLLYRARGWAPWPACSRRLGLRGDPTYGRTGAAPARSAARPATRPPAGAAARPPAHTRVTPRVHHRRPRTIPPAHRTQPISHRDAPIAVWSTPDGGRWGRAAAGQTPGAGPGAATVRIPVAAFRYLAPANRHRRADPERPGGTGRSALHGGSAR